MDAVETEDGKIRSVHVQQMNTEKEFIITGTIFVDATGDGMLSDLAGADYTVGRESKEVYGESMHLMLVITAPWATP